MEEQKKEEAPKEPELSDREKLYQELAAKAEASETPVAPEEAPPVVAEEPKKEPEVKVEAPPAEAPKAEEKPKDKFVPYDALHAERMKRKAEAEARKAAEDRAKALEETMARLKAEEPVPVTDYDSAIAELQRKTRAIELIEEQRIKREQIEAQQRNIQFYRRTMEEINNELASEGYRGFKYAEEKVRDEVMRLVHEDESNSMYDNKAGYKKIFKEKFYPEMEKEFKELFEAKKKAEKEDLKSQAGLINSAGKSELKPKTGQISDEDARKQYIASRQAQAM